MCLLYRENSQTNNRHMYSLEASRNIKADCGTSSALT
jgi:hypothetical protein